MWPAGTTPPPPHEAIPEAWLDTIDEAIKHRGPDGQGRFRDRVMRADGSVVDVALVHRRLAIIDPACGQQPMVSERGRSEPEGLVAVVFNGCIYNHRELRRELEAKGHRFVTDHSDTEVLVHGWREWKIALFHRLVAMGALALWDRNLGGLLLHRTAPGEKPLYTFETEECTAFASVPAALAKLVCFLRPVPMHNMIDSTVRWIALGQDDDLTPLEGIEQITYGTPCGLGPGIADSLNLDGESSILPGDEESEQSDEPGPGTLEQRVETLIAQAVADRLEADAPLCCLLSGGVDSSLIAHFAKGSAGQVRTLSIRMPTAAYDESHHAEAVARHLGTDHTTIDAGTSPAQDLLHLIPQLGLPFGDSSLLPTYWACKAASAHAKVLLTGDGGDELFYGYERYIAAHHLMALQTLPRFLFRLLPVGLLPRRDPKSKYDKLARLLTAAEINSYTSLLAIFQHPDLRKLVGNAAWRMGWGRNFLGALSARDEDLRHHLQGDMLRKVDTASMSIPVETRAPFLDQSLIRAVRTLLPSQGMPRGQRKGLLRAIARKYLPAGIVDRPKQGFAIPIGDWFRSDYGGMKTLLMDHLNAAEPWPGIGVELNRRFVRQMVDEHMGQKRDHSQRLYMLLVLSIWAKSLK